MNKPRDSRRTRALEPLLRFCLPSVRRPGTPRYSTRVRTEWLATVVISLCLAGAASAQDAPLSVEVGAPDWTVPEHGSAHSGMLCALALSPDGKRLATSSFDRTVKLWDLAARELIWKLELPPGGRGAIAFFPDGTRLAGGLGDGSVLAWNVADGSEARRYGKHAAKLTGVAVSPDGRDVAAISQDGELRCWEATTGAARFRLTAGVGYPSVAFSPDGRLLAVASPSQTWPLAVVEAATGRPLLLPQGPWSTFEYTAPVVWISDRSLAAFSQVVSLYDGRSGASPWAPAWTTPWIGSGREICGLASVPGRPLLVAGGASDRITFLERDTGRIARTAQLSYLPAGQRSGPLAFTSDGSFLLVGSQDGQVAAIAVKKLLADPPGGQPAR